MRFSKLMYAVPVGFVIAVSLLAVRSSESPRSTIPDQVAFLGYTALTKPSFLVFDRRFRFLSSTDLSQFGADDPTEWAPLGPSGYVVPADPLDVQFAAGIPFAGGVSYVTNLPFNPIAAATDRQGYTYVLTRIGLFGAGPIQKLDPSGAIVDSFTAPVSFWLGGYPWDIDVDSEGNLFICAADVAIAEGRVVKFTPAGNVLWQRAIPPPGGGTASVASIAVDRQGDVWALVVATERHFMLLDGDTGETVRDHDIVPIQLAWGGSLSLDPFDRLYILGNQGNIINQFDPVTGTHLQSLQMAGLGPPNTAAGLAFDPKGEEIWTLPVVDPSGNVHMGLAKTSIVTYQSSVLGLDAWLASWGVMPATDPLGFLRAHVVDPLGDSDGDGFANRAEIDARESLRRSVSSRRAERLRAVRCRKRDDASLRRSRRHRIADWNCIAKLLALHQRPADELLLAPHWRSHAVQPQS